MSYTIHITKEDMARTRAAYNREHGDADEFPDEIILHAIVREYTLKNERNYIEEVAEVISEVLDVDTAHEELKKGGLK